MSGDLRIGVNWHNKARGGAERSADEKVYQLGFFKQLNPSAQVVMNNHEFAQELFAALPRTIVINRQQSDAEGHMWEAVPDALDYFNRQKGISKPGIPLYLLNEPDSKMPKERWQAKINWLVKVMGLYAEAGLQLVVDNLGAHHPEMYWFTDNDRWKAMQPLFDAFKRFPMHFWGLHPYWSKDGLKPEQGSSAIHRTIAAHLADRNYDMPQLIFTEIGRDTYAGSKTNGWRSTGVSEEVYAAEIITARNTLWTEPYIRGACVYCYGSSTMQWWPFDIENAKVLHSALIAVNATAQQPPPKEPPPPKPVPVDLATLRLVKEHVSAVATRTRAMSLELAGISDDLLKDAQLLAALIQARETGS
jgi:hypothetical protein